MTTLPKLRSIKQCHDWLIKNDPEMRITVSLLRRLVNEGKIPSVRNGRNILIDLNALPDAIAGWVSTEQDSQAGKMAAPEKKKPMSAVERASMGGKYGQVRAL